MRLISNYAQKSFLGYALFEHFLTTALLGAGVPACAFFGIVYLGRRNSERGTELLETVFSEEGRNLMLVVAVLVVLINVALVLLRRTTYVVGAELDDRQRVVRLQVRGMAREPIEQVEVPYDRFSWTAFTTPGIPGMNRYNGSVFRNNGRTVGHFLIDHFTWDGQARNVRSFLKELNSRVAKSPG